MADSESEERLQRAASLRRTVAETIARVRRTTAHIGTPRPPGEVDPPEAVKEAEAPPPEVAEPAAEGDGGLGRDVGALLERTRSVIARTRRVIEESKASLTHKHRGSESPDPEDGPPPS
ncbi:MAG TPA: hypothetical protein VFR81_29745 [Longimicrobium sp.]|nr:hypothetical protein [Longimicrobium sp.]